MGNVKYYTINNIITLYSLGYPIGGSWLRGGEPFLTPEKQKLIAIEHHKNMPKKLHNETDLLY